MLSKIVTNWALSVDNGPANEHGNYANNNLINDHIAFWQSTILAWYHQHGRKNLPWQQQKTPYSIWLSEIMLQQTQVTTVIPYFQRFITTFPDIAALANAKLDKVLHLWSGLGYYTRAKNLHQAAKLIVTQFNSTLPCNLQALQQLPGIGRSTAGAIIALSFNKKASILDGNVKRLLTRYYGIAGWPNNTKVQKKLWQLAENLSPAKCSANYNQALMDLGAMICKRTKPNCCYCPLNHHCIAYHTNQQQQLPHKKPSKILPIRHTTMMIIQNQNQQILLQQRPLLGVWPGLWSFPQCSGDIVNFCQNNYHTTPLTSQLLTKFRHTFSHFHLDITAIIVKIVTDHHNISEAKQTIWYQLDKPQALGIPRPVKKLLEQLTKLQRSTGYDKKSLLSKTSQTK